MLSITLAARQQSRCLQSALVRRASTFTTSQQNGINKSLLLKHLPILSSSTSNGSIVPQTYFSTSSSRAMSGAGSDHVKMWTLEKVVSFMQIPCFIVPFMLTNPVTDAIFCTLLVLHSHWGEIDAAESCDSFEYSYFHGFVFFHRY